MFLNRGIISRKQIFISVSTLHIFQKSSPILRTEDCSELQLSSLKIMLPAEGVALITSTPTGRSRGWLYTRLELRISLLAVWRLAIDEECGMGLTLGEVSGEESMFFCPGTESRLSDETPSEALALKRN